jgi:isoquinoline 1-oxidoreductase beta subunit
MRHGYVRPPTHHVLRARLLDGRIEALEHRQASGEVAGAFIPGFVMFMMGSDFGAWRGGRLMYDAPHLHTEARDEVLPVATGWWRGLGLMANLFAIESFVDELAHAAAADPLAFRLDHLPNNAKGTSMRRVLEAAAERAGWDDTLPPGRARGIAGCSDAGTQVACVAEVSLDDDGTLVVHRVTAAMDCGRVIHPDGATAQVEGNIMWGVGSALVEELTVANGQIEAANFDRYPLLTISQAPEVEVVLLETEGAAPTGVGEPPIGPVAPAIANALFALTGARVRQLPITPERIAAARA